MKYFNTLLHFSLLFIKFATDVLRMPHLLSVLCTHLIYNILKSTIENEHKH